jgi:hypothetical protein
MIMARLIGMIAFAPPFFNPLTSSFDGGKERKAHQALGIVEGPYITMLLEYRPLATYLENVGTTAERVSKSMVV